MIVLGIDPGKNGALALYDSEWSEILKVWDMPTYKKTVGSGKSAKKRDEIDKVALIGIFDEALKSYGQVGRAVLELVGQRPTIRRPGRGGDSNALTDGPTISAQTGMFAFGQAWGYVDMLLTVYSVPIEYARPQVWKRELKCPSDKTETVYRADQIFPAYRDLWRGPRGGLLDGRAEACLIAFWGAKAQQ